MQKYFKCQEWCTACCPGSKEAQKGMVTTLTIGDIYRSFKFNNPKRQNFYDVFTNQFKLIGMPPFTIEKEELSESVSRLEERGYEVIVTEKTNFNVLPSPKNSCSNLCRNGCKAHKTPIKYLTCVLNPEMKLMKDKIHEEEYNFFPCIKGKQINPKEKDRISALMEIMHKEDPILSMIFPVIVKPSDDESEYKSKEIKLEKTMLEKIMRKNIEPLNTARNRFWEEEIRALTKEYAKIIGFKINLKKF